MVGGRQEQLKTAVFLSFAVEPDQINTCDSPSWFYFWWFIIRAQVFHLLFLELPVMSVGGHENLGGRAALFCGEKVDAESTHGLHYMIQMSIQF